MKISLKRISVSRRWLLLSLIPLLLLLGYTMLVISGTLDVLTVHQEQWLLQRPITRFDCVLHQWRYLGEAPVNLGLFLIICGVCWLLKYPLRVALVLLLLFGVGLTAEYLGKQYIYQPVPSSFDDGMAALGCPQIWRVSHAKLIPLSLGVWSVAPDAPPFRVAEARAAATASYSRHASSNEDYYVYTTYPSGHAARWMLIGLLALWLAWRQIRRRFLRRLLMLVFLTLAFAGGFVQFYTGAHLFTDMIGGYLLGAFLACCAIAALLSSEKRNRWMRERVARAATSPDNDCDPTTLSIAVNSDRLLREKL